MCVYVCGCGCVFLKNSLIKKKGGKEKTTADGRSVFLLFFIITVTFFFFFFLFLFYSCFIMLGEKVYTWEKLFSFFSSFFI